MSVRIPDFRNIFTTGNVISALSAAFIAGMAWMNVQGALAAHGKELDTLKRSDDITRVDVVGIKVSVGRIETSQQDAASQLTDIKRWMERLSDKLDKR